MSTLYKGSSNKTGGISVVFYFIIATTLNNTLCSTGSSVDKKYHLFISAFSSMKRCCLPFTYHYSLVQYSKHPLSLL